MSELELPEQLDGPWHHALILTYGADIPFLENALWRQFGSKCRNKVILADGQRHLEACAVYAKNRRVRHLNQLYITEGILVPQAAHAKAILLTNPEQGCLLVGSGNLGWQGYASGGELFTAYEYSEETPGMLNAFLAVRELVDALIEQSYVSGSAVQRIRDIWEKTPWLFRTPVGDWQPVRHNLNTSFLNQLLQEVGDGSVEELLILSPFYDPRAIALERTLATLNPHQTTLLMQPGSTSVDVDALKQVLARYPGEWRVCSALKGDESPYIHAKLYLLKMTDRAVCLQGSPNLSQVAMLLSVPEGNVEMANLMTGPRDAFDGLLQALDIQESSLDSLDLVYQADEKPVESDTPQVHLTGGEWDDDQLLIRYQGSLPDLQGAFLQIEGLTFPLDLLSQDVRQIQVRLLARAAELLQRPVPLAICWGEGNDAKRTNPIFVCNVAALNAEISATGDGKTLSKMGDLDLEDDELEKLLADLDAALLIDRQSAWQLAGQTKPQDRGAGQALILSYEDVDYEALRQHPKVQQYLHRSRPGSVYSHSRLQIILSAITDHFRGLLDESPAQLQIPTDPSLDEDGDEDGTEDTGGSKKKRKPSKRPGRKRRIRRILKGFIRRYLRGIKSKDFQQFAGFEVVSQNYIIFCHLLWRLFFKDWLEKEYILLSLLEIWAFFWGDGTRRGYFFSLLSHHQDQALQWVREHSADSNLLACLYYGGRSTRMRPLMELRFALRDFWRGILPQRTLRFSDKAVEEAWHAIGPMYPYNPPTPTAIAEELAQLAKFESHEGFLRAVEEQYGYYRGSCSFQRQRIYRESIDDNDTVECLTIGVGSPLLDRDSATTILRRWIEIQGLDYYRVSQPKTGRLAFYDAQSQEGLYFDRESGEVALENLAPDQKAWGASLSQLLAQAKTLEEVLTPRFRESVSASTDRGFIETEA